MVSLRIAPPAFRPQPQTSHGYGLVRQTRRRIPRGAYHCRAHPSGPRGRLRGAHGRCCLEAKSGNRQDTRVETNGGKTEAVTPTSQVKATRPRKISSSARVDTCTGVRGTWSTTKYRLPAVDETPRAICNGRRK